MASFNGTDLGFIFEMNPGPNPIALQINTYPGAGGLEVLVQGSRGGRTTLEGAFLASTIAGVAALEQAIRTLMAAGNPGTLVDTAGTSWSNVLLVGFAPQGRYLTMVGGYARRYQAEFLHAS